MHVPYLQQIAFGKKAVYKHTTAAERKQIKAALVNGASVPGIHRDFVILHPEKIKKYAGKIHPSFSVLSLYLCTEHWKRTNQIPNKHRSNGTQIKSRVSKERTAPEILL